MPLILIKILGYVLSAGSVVAAAWWIYDKIGDGAVAAYQNMQLLSAMEMDAREDVKTDSVLATNRTEIDKLRRATDVLARTLSAKFKTDPCWNHPLPADFVRLYKDRDSKGVQTFTDDANHSDPPS